MKLESIKRSLESLIVGAVAVFTLLAGSNLHGQSKIKTEGNPLRSLGSEMAGEVEKMGPTPSGIIPVPGGGAFDGPNFDDNAVFNGGFRFIPPDPHGASGIDRVIAVVNTIIDARTKTGGSIFRTSLRSFFSPLGSQTLNTFTFDPKVIYDQYENRFVVVTLEVTEAVAPAVGGESRLLVAVSKTSSPATPTAADWNYLAINSKTTISGFDRWADYPGLAIDEEAVYVNANMFRFINQGGTFGGVRLWIIGKGVSGGFYGGGSASVTVHNPYSVPGSIATTTQPAHVFGTNGAGAGIGTYLVSYSGLSDGIDEYVQVIRVDNPLGATSFSQQFIDIGNIEDFPPGGLLDAPQLGTATLIEVNDRRTLNAVWRDDALWLTTTIRPNSGTNVNQTSAYWWKLDTSTPATMTVADQSLIGGEEIAPGTYTFFPSLAVNCDGDMKIGFSASAPSIYAGAYVSGREAGDPLGTLQPSAVVKAGQDFYIRTFSTNPAARNRWGDYSGISVDPTEDESFWVFNEYAMLRGPADSRGHEGRWGTAWMNCQFDSPPTVVFNPIGPFCSNAPSFDLNTAVTPVGGVFTGAGVSGNIFNPAAAGAGSHVIIYAFTDARGCTKKTSQTVVVNPSPTANAGADATICVGETVTIGGNPTGSGGTGALTFSWTPTTGLNDPASPNPKARPVVTTTYTVTVTDEKGCQDTDEVTITVHDEVFLTEKYINSNGHRASEGNLHTNGSINFYAGGPSLLKGNLQAGNTIIIRPNNTIDGNVTAGIHFSLIGKAKATGGANIAPVPTIPLPVLSFTAGGNGVTVGQKKALTLLPGSYGEVKVLAGGKLALTSGNYFMNKLELSNSTLLALDVTTGPITINVVENLQFGAKARVVITPSGPMASAQVGFLTLAKGGVNIGANSLVRGAIIAPHSLVTLGQNSQFKGSICAEKIHIGNGVSFFHHSSASLPKEESEAEESEIASNQSSVISYDLAQNYPNPFSANGTFGNLSTMISFALPEAGNVTVNIFNEMGQLVRKLVDGEMTVGRHQMHWNARNQSGKLVAAGVYLYQIVAQGKAGNTSFTQTKHMTLLK